MPTTLYKPLRIAVFCANEFSVPPAPQTAEIYAPLWLTHYTTEELVKRGHHVTLFASSDSKTKAQLVSNGLISFHKRTGPKQLLKNGGAVESSEYLRISKLSQVALTKKFDVILVSLIGIRPLPFAALIKTPTIFVLNEPLDPLLVFLFNQYKERYSHLHFIGISKSQVKQAAHLFVDVVYNGVKIEDFKLNHTPQNYLLASGRINPEKGIFEAIRTAQKLNQQLVIMGTHEEDHYWHKKVKPFLKNNITYIGPVPYRKVHEVYGDAKVLLFPIQWEEPFGMVMIEAMACGTPVVAFDRGSVKEVIKDKKTGFIVKPFDQQGKPNLRGLIEAVKCIPQINRRKCREWVQENFTIERMVDGYEKVFYKILSRYRRIQ